MSNKGELDEISQTSRNKDVALLAQEMGFLVEQLNDFRTQTKDDFRELRNNTSGMYAPKTTVEDHEKRIARLEKAALWILGSTFAVVFLAVLGLVIIKR